MAIVQPSREDEMRIHAARAAERLVRAGDTLARRQAGSGPLRGNVPPWSGIEDADLHGTLAAICVWARAQKLAGSERFAGPLRAAWAFVRTAWPRFVPPALGAAASDEAAFDCAMALRAALADPAGIRRAEASGLAENAARLLGAYLTDLDELGGRAFQDPGFLAWNLACYARATNDRGLVASARKFVDRAFGMKTPPPFTAEPATTDGLFDFSSTTATRVLAVIAAEGSTPFVGAWLRERVAPAVPAGFLTRAMDENSWNACVATCLGQAFVVATDPALLQGYRRIMAELERRVGATTGGLGRQRGFEDETLATFQHALALESLVKE